MYIVVEILNKTLAIENFSKSNYIEMITYQKVKLVSVDLTILTNQNQYDKFSTWSTFDKIQRQFLVKERK